MDQVVSVVVAGSQTISCLEVAPNRSRDTAPIGEQETNFECYGSGNKQVWDIAVLRTKEAPPYSKRLVAS